MEQLKKFGGTYKQVIVNLSTGNTVTYLKRNAGVVLFILFLLTFEYLCLHQLQSFQR
jgi:hypothetical protein